MNITEFIKSLARDLQADRDERNFYQYVIGKLDNFMNGLSNITEEDMQDVLNAHLGLNRENTKECMLHLIDFIVAEVKSILQLLYKGDFFNAYNSLVALLTDEKVVGGKLYDMYINYLEFKVESKNNPYYRIVIAENPKNSNHLPFSLRSYAAPSRFNMTGYPCLYLASSQKIAELETGNTNDTSWLGIFKAKKNLFFLGFKIPTEQEIEKMTDNAKFAFVITYPLFVLNLTKVANGNATFHEEYMFSQMFFHLLFEDEKKTNCYWDGICYSSTHDASECNLVIPAKYEGPEPCTDDSISPYILERFEQIEMIKLSPKRNILGVQPNIPLEVAL